MVRRLRHHRVSNHVDCEIVQEEDTSISYTWKDYKFAQFSDWVNIFKPGVISSPTCPSCTILIAGVILPYNINGRKRHYHNLGEYRWNTRKAALPAEGNPSDAWTARCRDESCILSHKSAD